MTTGNILIVEDERTTRLVLAEAFRQLGYQADTARSAEEAISKIAVTHFDVVLLDLKMPGAGGLAVLERADQLDTETDFIVMTAHASTESAITALRSRARDYLIKPSSIPTIVKAVRGALADQAERRREKEAVALLDQVLHQNGAARPLEKVLDDPELVTESHKVVRAAGIEIDMAGQTAVYQNKNLSLTPIEFRLLAYFVHHPDIVFSYPQLARVSHQLEVDRQEARQLLRTHLYRLSRKLGSSEESPLQSVRGRGFILHS